MCEAPSIYGHKTTEIDNKWAMLSGSFYYEDSTFRVIFVKITLNSLP